MSQLIRPLAVLDSVLDLKDSCHFAVEKSAQNITAQKYKANSATANQLVFAIQVPSLSTVVSRNIIISADLTFQLNGTVPQYSYLWNGDAVNQTWNAVSYQQGDTVAPFLLHSLINNATVQINNTSVVLNDVQRVLDPILRGLNPQKIQEMYGSTPCQLDYYADYTNALPEGESNAGALAANIVPNKGYESRWNSPFNRALNMNCKALESRNSFEIKSIVGNTPGANPAVAQTVTITIHVEEPLVLSPYLFGGDIDAPGLSGITQMNYTFSLDATAKRALRWINSRLPAGQKTCQFVGFGGAGGTEAYMTLKYYTPHPTQLVPATIVTPLQQFVNFQSQTGNDLQPGDVYTDVSPSLQLNSVPDKFILWVDDEYKYINNGNTTIPNNVADHYASLTNINVTFGNQTGIMSTFTQKQLYEVSRQSGSYQSFDEFSGLANLSTAGVAGNQVSKLSTCGSVLMCDFGRAVNLAEVYAAPGLLQTTQFQVRVTAVNNTGDVIRPRINVMFIYSGILSTSQGNSSSYVNGILTRNDVLNAANAPNPVTHAQLHRYIGSGIVEDAKAMAESALPMAKKVLSSAMDTLGLGQEAGAMAGAMAGAQTGGLLAGRRSRLASKML